jgi:hypothetical protein
MAPLNKYCYDTYNIVPRGSGCGFSGRGTIGVCGGVILCVVAGAVVEELLCNVKSLFIVPQ